MSKHKKGPEKKKAEPGKLEFKMRWMLFSTMIPMAVLIIVLLVVFWQYTNEYNKLSNNLAVSSEYNANYKNSSNDMSFKAEVDMDIYYVTIGRKGKDDLPVKQVNKAIGKSSFTEISHQLSGKSKKPHESAVGDP